MNHKLVKTTLFVVLGPEYVYQIPCVESAWIFGRTISGNVP